jgi:hypothetical protein
MDGIKRCRGKNKEKEDIIKKGTEQGRKSIIAAIYGVGVPSPWGQAVCSDWDTSPLDKPPFAQLLRNLLNSYGTRRFITVLTRTLDRSLP